MPEYSEAIVRKILLPAEHDQLFSKGYLKLKIELTLEHLRMLQSEYKVGDQFIFYSRNNSTVETLITSIDTGEPHGENYKVFIGFTLVVN